MCGKAQKGEDAEVVAEEIDYSSLSEGQLLSKIRDLESGIDVLKKLAEFQEELEDEKKRDDITAGTVLQAILICLTITIAMRFIRDSGDVRIEKSKLLSEASTLEEILQKEKENTNQRRSNLVAFITENHTKEELVDIFTEDYNEKRESLLQKIETEILQSDNT
eukprot:TRINITY_DN13354_c0_g1_i1.p2 TRINITY_DN13354_c0_g1~~TRINITY_DN13354_c0_g1_i1.p2  ORF type:complete len:164 (+),score=47.47 TRINITY_DN13354_c0_g1_i1:187-678(+)